MPSPNRTKASGFTRIIAGAARGLRLGVPPGLGTRPTPDRVREALFSMLVEPGERVLDLFAGTGALGLEALSRGAAHATFVEHDPRVVAILRQNVAHVTRAVAAETQVLDLTVREALANLADDAFDLVFVDPPYAAGELPPTLAALCDQRVLARHARVICEHSSRQPAPVAPSCLQLQQTRSWGEVALTFYAQEQP